MIFCFWSGDREPYREVNEPDICNHGLGIGLTTLSNNGEIYYNWPSSSRHLLKQGERVVTIYRGDVLILYNNFKPFRNLQYLVK